MTATNHAIPVHPWVSWAGIVYHVETVAGERLSTWVNKETAEYWHGLRSRMGMKVKLVQESKIGFVVLK